MNANNRTRLIIPAGLLTLFLMIIVPAGFVFADLIQSQGQRWQATFQQKNMPADISESGRGMHYVQDHTSEDQYDIFPMRASLFQISEAKFLILNNELDLGEQFNIDLVILDQDGVIQNVLSHRVITAENCNAGVWQSVELSTIELLSSHNRLAFHVYAGSFSGNHKIAYEVLVHNLFTEFNSYLPLIFR